MVAQRVTGCHVRTLPPRPPGVAAERASTSSLAVVGDPKLGRVAVSCETINS